MEARYQRKLQSGENYNHFFPRANGQNLMIKGNADVSHTLELIPKVVKETLHHTSQLAQHLKGNNLNETCKNIWDFVYQHIAYQKDEDGKEQVRSPARVWQDRKQGVDCDCYTTFISSILTNLHIPHIYRITKYFKPHYQHIYPIVPLSNGKHITIDCVVEQYNYEEPYSAKKDTTMDLQYLNGIEDENNNEEILFTENHNVDIQDLIGFEDDFEMGDLGRRKSKSVSKYEPKHKSKVGSFLHKAIHVANKANPATVLLRNGLLASMKLNIFKVAQRLKWAYLSDVDAKNKGVDIAKFERLKKVRAKLEGIFFSSGGQPENLKKAILKGKGNRGHEVNGIEGYDEFDLGDPATGASIASATAVIASIAGILKSIGNIFPKKEAGAEDFENTENGEKGATSSTSLDEKKTVEPSITEEGKANPESNIAPESNNNSSNPNAMMKVANSNSQETKTAEEKTDDDSTKKEGDGMWEKNKKWMKPTLIGVGSVSLLVIGYKVLTAQKPPPPNARKQPLNGTPKRKKASPKKTQFKSKELF